MSRIQIKNEKHKALFAIALGLLLFGYGLLQGMPQIYEEHSAYSAISDAGVEAKAHISYGDTLPGTIKGTVDHRIDFSWRDRAGKEREVKSLSVSDDVWNWIASGKNLTVREIPIKYLESDQKPRAIFVWDPNAMLRRVLWEVLGVAAAILLGGGAVIKGLQFLFKRREQPNSLVTSATSL